MKLSLPRLCFVCALAALVASPMHAQREKLPIDDLEIVEKKWPAAKKTSTGLRYVVLKEGDKTAGSPAAGMFVSTLYTGSLIDGKVFEEKTDAKDPLKIRLGRGNLIDAWEEALQKMHKGDKWLLIVPYQLGYGTRGKPPVIPRCATLIFEIELLDFGPE